MIEQTKLTEDKAIETLQSFFHEKPFLFFGSGVSCALDERFGMVALKNAIIHSIDIDSLSNDQKNQWNNLKNGLQKGLGLETALNAINDQYLLKKITKITGDFIASIDREYAYKIANHDIEWPAARLMKKLVDTLPESDPILHALTPNYDMLFEYACDNIGISYTNGFIGGVERKINWQAAFCSLCKLTKVKKGRKLEPVCKPKKHVHLYKVHGSLNYFYHHSCVVENNSWMWCPPCYAQRVMITPGLSKYETLQRYRLELQKSADDAIDNASQFLFIGYGFNDKHLDEYINRKMITDGCKGLIITRDLNLRIKKLLDEATNLWLVCKAEGSTNNGTRVYNKQYSNWLNLSTKRLWDIKEFTEQILGG